MKRKPSTKKAAFLAAYEACGNVSQACKAARFGRSLHYRMLERSEAYRREFEAATARAVAVSQGVAQSDEAFIRAMARALRLEARRLLKALKTQKP